MEAPRVEAARVEVQRVKAPAEAQPADVALVDVALIEPAPAKAPPVEVALVEPEPVEAVPVGAALLEAAAMEAALVESPGAPEAVLFEAPVREAPVRKAPVRVARVRTGPVRTTPVRPAAPASPAARPVSVDVALSVVDLSKSFGTTKAADAIELEVHSGSLYGMVGPNGAGKTTTLSMISGLLRPDSGVVRVYGADVWANPAVAKKSLGVLPDRLRLFDRLTGAEFLHHAGALHGLDRKTVAHRSADLAAAFGLQNSMHRLVSDYSVGLTKKIAIAAAMIHSPRLLVLDEPFESVDPVSVAMVIDILKRFTSSGGTVLLSSHSMELIEHVCDSVAIIAEGRVLTAGAARGRHPGLIARGALRRTRRRHERRGGHGVVAELLRLRLRLLVNNFRRSPLGVFGILVGLAAAVAGVVVAWNAASALQVHEDDYVRRMMVAVGALLLVSAFLLPLVFSRRASLHPLAFRGYGIRADGIVAILLVFALTGPLLLMLAVAYASAEAWPDAASRDVALVAAPILFLIALFTVLIGRALGVALRNHPHTSGMIAFLSIVVLLVGAAMVLVIAAQRIPELMWLVRLTGPIPFVRGYSGFLAETPIGMLWSAPWLASTTAERPDDAWAIIWIGVAIAVVLFAIWASLVGWQLRPTRRLRMTRRSLSTGWFGRLPSSPTGAVAARSFSYWLRDPRYRTVLRAAADPADRHPRRLRRGRRALPVRGSRSASGHGHRARVVDRAQ